MTKRQVGAFVALLLLSGGACSETVEQARRTPPVETAALSPEQAPCRLLEKAEIEKEVRASVKQGVPHRGLPPIGVIGMRYCVFESTLEPGKPSPTVYVGHTSAFAHEVFEKYKQGPGSQNLQAVEALGSAALYSEFGPSSSLVVLGRDQVIGVSLFLVKNNPRQAAENLARKATAKAGDRQNATMEKDQSDG